MRNRRRHAGMRGFVLGRGQPTIHVIAPAAANTPHTPSAIASHRVFFQLL